jgi:hypothetical protein
MAARSVGEAGAPREGADGADGRNGPVLPSRKAWSSHIPKKIMGRRPNAMKAASRLDR